MIKLKIQGGNSPQFKNIPCKGAANALLAHLCALKAGWKWFATPDQQNMMKQYIGKKQKRLVMAIIGSEIGEATGLYRLVSTPEEISTNVFKGNSTESILRWKQRSWWEEIGSVNSTYTDIWALTYCYWVVDVKTERGRFGCDSRTK